MGSGFEVVCRSCDRKVKMELIKFDDIRKAYVCEVCYSATHKTKKQAPVARSALVDDAEKSINTLKNSLIKYNCTKCKYHFARQKDKAIKACPYCGSDKLQISSKDASRIISESDSVFH